MLSTPRNNCSLVVWYLVVVAWRGRADGDRNLIVSTRPSQPGERPHTLHPACHHHLLTQC